MDGNYDLIYSKIKELASKLRSQGLVYTRADLASEIRYEDSDEVSQIVYNAYAKFGWDASIRTAFVTNDQSAYVVDAFKMQARLMSGDAVNALKLTQKSLDASASHLRKIGDQMDLGHLLAEVRESDLGKWIEGTNRLSNIQKTAQSMMTKYHEMVETYNSAKCGVRGNIKDFTDLRASIVDVYVDFATQLVDVFGNLIKAVSPDLFDFNKIEWLDVDAMLQEVLLEYQNLAQNCQMLTSAISQHFEETAQNAANDFKALGGGSWGMAAVAVEGFCHYSDAKQKTNMMEAELERLKAIMKRDATNVKADVLRLFAIYKTLNDVAIPKANTYLRWAAQLLESDYGKVIEAVYAQPCVKELIDKRKKLANQLLGLEASVNDHLLHIDIYKSQITAANDFLSRNQESYEEAVAQRPSKPPLLLSLLTFYYVNSTYVKNRVLWNMEYGDMANRYEELLVDSTLGKEELDKHRKAVENLGRERERIMKEMDDLSEQIRAKLVVSDDVRNAMLKHLRPIVALLRLGREISETKLDDELVSAVHLPDYASQMGLPAEIEANISHLAENLTNVLHRDNPTGDMRTEMLNSVVSSGVKLAESYSKLYIIRQQGKEIAAQYDEDFNQLRQKFSEKIGQIDDKSACIREIIRQVNLASSPEEQKAAILMLSEAAGGSLSENDIDAFLRGDQQIVL